MRNLILLVLISVSWDAYPQKNVSGKDNKESQNCTLYSVDKPSDPTHLAREVTICRDGSTTKISENKAAQSAQKEKDESQERERLNSDNDLVAQQKMGFWTHIIGVSVEYWDKQESAGEALQTGKWTQKQQP